MAERATDAGTGVGHGETGRDAVASAVLFVAALLPRLWVALAWAREPVWDGHYYDFGARRIAAGLGYSDDVIVAGRTAWHPWCHYPVGYSGLLGAVYRVFGDGPHVGPVANAVVGALLAAATHRLALRITTVGRARLAGAIVAASPGLVAYAALLMTEPLAALGLVVTTWAFARSRTERPLRGAVVAGLVLGLTTLVRPQTLLCAPALAWIAWPRTRGRPIAQRLGAALLPAAVALAAALVVVAPWTVRNCRVMDGCALVSTNAGWNLAIGAFPRATGRFETLRATDGCPVVTGQVQQDRCWRDEALRWIAADPWRWLALAPKKLGYLFDHESYPVGYLAEANPAAWPEERRATARGVLSTTHRLLLSAAPLGLVALPSRARRREAESAAGGARTPALLETALAVATVAALAAFGFASDAPTFWPLALCVPVLGLVTLPGRLDERGALLSFLAFVVASLCATHVVFFGEDRYHVVVTPVLAILAACALERRR